MSALATRWVEAQAEVRSRWIRLAPLRRALMVFVITNVVAALALGVAGALLVPLVPAGGWAIVGLLVVACVALAALFRVPAGREAPLALPAVQQLPPTDHVVGHDTVRRKVAERLTQGDHVVVTGARGIGTSAVASVAAKAHAGDVFYIDLAGVRVPVAFDELCAHVKNHVPSIRHGSLVVVDNVEWPAIVPWPPPTADLRLLVVGRPHPGPTDDGRDDWGKHAPTEVGSLTGAEAAKVFVDAWNETVSGESSSPLVAPGADGRPGDRVNPTELIAEVCGRRPGVLRGLAEDSCRQGRCLKQLADELASAAGHPASVIVESGGAPVVGAAPVPASWLPRSKFVRRLQHILARRRLRWLPGRIGARPDATLPAPIRRGGMDLRDITYPPALDTVANCDVAYRALLSANRRIFRRLALAPAPLDRQSIAALAGEREQAIKEPLNELVRAGLVRRVDEVVVPGKRSGPGEHGGERFARYVVCPDSLLAARLHLCRDESAAAVARAGTWLLADLTRRGSDVLEAREEDHRHPPRRPGLRRAREGWKADGVTGGGQDTRPGWFGPRRVELLGAIETVLATTPLRPVSAEAEPEGGAAGSEGMSGQPWGGAFEPGPLPWRLRRRWFALSRVVARGFVAEGLVDDWARVAWVVRWSADRHRAGIWRWAHNQLGAIYLLCGQPSDAIRALDAAVPARGRWADPQVHTNLGIAHIVRGDPERAIGYLRRAAGHRMRGDDAGRDRTRAALAEARRAVEARPAVDARAQG